METKPIEKLDAHTRGKGYSRCGGFLGYLTRLPENASIPQECLTCPKLLDCAMEITDF